MPKINRVIVAAGLVSLLAGYSSNANAEESMNYSAINSVNLSTSKPKVDPELTKLKNRKEEFGRAYYPKLRNACNKGYSVISTMERTTRSGEVYTYDLLFECWENKSGDEHIRWAINLDNVFTAYSTEYQPLSISLPGFIDRMFKPGSVTIGTHKGDVITIGDLDRGSSDFLAELFGRYSAANNLGKESYEYMKRFQQINERPDGPANR